LGRATGSRSYSDVDGCLRTWREFHADRATQVQSMTEYERIIQF
jgi:hypothetical protein